MSQPPSQKPKTNEEKEAARKAKADKKAAEEEELAEKWAVDASQFAKRGERQWKTLCHNGVVFPPPYVPHGIPVLYGLTEFKMTPEEEEICTMYAEMKDSDFYKNPKFRTNFFKAWTAILDKRRQPHPIKLLELCDFNLIWEHVSAERLKKKNRSPAEKKAAKDLQKEMDLKYKWCMWNGKKEKLANYVVEKPGLFRGRGDHPKTGEYKTRIYPEDVIINIGEGEPVPPPPAGHEWKDVVHEHDVTWLAMWKDSVNENHKYMMLGASSSVKGQSDILKFEKARELGANVDRIRASYRKDFQSKDRLTQQRAIATYFIDRLALRAGGSKDIDEEADTVGCCSLRREHITPLPVKEATAEPGSSTSTEAQYRIFFDFPGKDSVPYRNTVAVDKEVYELIRKWHGTMARHTRYFDFEPSELNKHLDRFMPGLTAKVFRTYNASRTLSSYFKTNPCDPKASDAEKILYFNEANLQVAVLCNHQRNISKNFGDQKLKMEAKTDEAKEHVERLEKAIVIEKKSGRSAAVKFFYEREDAVQYAWIDAHGTPEDRQAYAELVRLRDEGGIGKNIKAKKAPREGTEPAAPATTGRKSAASTKPSAAKKPRTETKAAVAVDSDDDLPLLQVAAKKKGKAPVAVADSDDELIEQAAKSGAKSAKGAKPVPKLSAKALAEAKKQAEKEAAEEEEDEEGEAEESDEDADSSEEETVAQVAAAKKSPRSSGGTKKPSPAKKKPVKKAPAKQAKKNVKPAPKSAKKASPKKASPSKKK